MSVSQNIKRQFSKFLLIMTLFISFLTIKTVEASEIFYKDKVDVHKSWKIRFSSDIDKESINKNNISILDKNDKKLDINIKFVDSRTVEVIPSEAYESNSQFELIVKKTIKDIHGNFLKDEVEFKFSTADFANEHLVMAWQPIYNQETYNAIFKNENNVVNIKSENTALQIISPTIFKTKWDGNRITGLNSIYDEKYFEKAEKNGYEIWPCIQVLPSNITLKDYENSVSEFLNNNELVEKTIDDLLKFIKKYNLSGVNIDFEAIGKGNREEFTLFMDKLYKKLNKESIKVSVCLGYPYENSPYFDFLDVKALNQFSDYLIFMAYDERVMNDEISGSISSYNWVRKGIEKLISLGAENEKLILGVPMYSLDFAVVEGESEYNSVIVTKRVVNGEEAKLYKSTSKEEVIEEVTYGELFITRDAFEGWYKVNFQGEDAYIPSKFVEFINPNQKTEYAVGWNTVSMKKIDDILNNTEYMAQIKYDEKAKQDVLVYYKYDNAKTVKLEHRIWLENEKSIQWRKALVKEFNLKGIGAWSLGLEKIEVWEKDYK